MDRVQGVGVHVVGEAAGASDTGDDHEVLAGDSQFWQGLLTTVKLYAVVNNPVKVAVFSRKDNRSAWCADTIGTKTVIKSHAFPGKSINMGCLVYLAPISTDSV